MKKTMRFALCRNGTGLCLIDATMYAGCDNTLQCDLCRQSVVWVRASSRASSHFRHREQSGCARNDDDNNTNELTWHESKPKLMSDWHKCWSNAVHPTFRECSMHGRPRDGGCVDTNTILEFQHSPISFEEFRERCDPVKFALWIFDYTQSTMFEYKPVLPSKTKHLFVQCKTFGAHPWLDVKHALVVIHGPDGKLYEMENHKCLQFETLGYVYCLKPLSSKSLQWIKYFMSEGTLPTHLSFAIAQPETVTDMNPINDAACYYLDILHRTLVTKYAIHTDLPLYVTAPAGSGKTTLLLDTCRKAPASHSILIVTFNKANQETMAFRCKQAGLNNVKCSTLDSLCYGAVRDFINGYAPLDLNTFVTDKWVIETFFPRCTPWHHKRHSKGIAAILERVVRTALPGTRRLSMCDKHEEDYGWIANQTVKGEGAWMSTFSGLRFQSLVHELFQALKPYDTVMVDEFQDLDVQALILILTIKSCAAKSKEPELVIQSRSSKKKKRDHEDKEPNFIFVGDPMQTIYDFGKSDDCAECEALYVEKIETMQAYLPSSSHTYHVKLYQSFRSPHHTMDYLSDVFPSAKGVSGLVESKGGTESTIHFVKEWYECPEESLILVRSKQELIELFDKGYGSSVVGGNQIAGEMTSILRYGSKRNASCSPFAKFVLGMPSGKTTRLSKHLAEASVTLDELSEMDGGISTVHRAKGFEWDHVAVPFSLFQNAFCPDTTERNVAYVAMSRHKIALWIVGNETSTMLKKPHTTVDEEEPLPRKGYCLHCGGKLRQFSSGDWEGRRYHKKCWIEMRKEEEW